jgi:hypothetical protein
MNGEQELLNRHLNGEIAYQDLPEALRREADGFERIADLMRNNAGKLPLGNRAAIMRRIRAEPAPAWSRAWEWIVTPRTLHLSPGMGGVALAAAALVLLLVRPGIAPVVPVEPVAPAEEPVSTVRFVLVAPEARSLAVTGDFVNWDPAGIPLQAATREGVWTAEIRLAPGVYNYVFIIDGTEWRPDPNAAMQADDGFGQQNSVLIVAPRTET